ncbi:MAG: hypothetical protein RI952_1528 [Bacteroidota bacterium]|jgi:hypothetical protein
MPVCEKHTRYIPEGQHCGACWSEGVLFKKAESKSSATKPSGIKKLKDKAQALFSKKIKAKYCKSKFVNCWTCGKAILSKGTSVTNTAHCGHYYPKSTHWELAYTLFNAGIQCYMCNCNAQGIIPAMRNKLVEVWGEEIIKQLDNVAEKFINEKKSGIKKSQPSEMWLIGQIELLKQETKNLK